MVSEAYKNMEDNVNNVRVVHNELVESIVRNLNKSKEIIERGLYLTSVSTGIRPADLAVCVNEFLISIDEEERFPGGEHEGI